jgi:hypothetical protein
MAAKYFCDGCDRELGGGGIAHNRVYIKEMGENIDSDDGINVSQFDLCNSCVRRLKPTGWIRQGKRQDG